LKEVGIYEDFFSMTKSLNLPLLPSDESVFYLKHKLMLHL